MFSFSFLFWNAGAGPRTTRSCCRRRASSSCSTTRPGRRCCAPCGPSSCGRRASSSPRSSSSTTPASEVRPCCASLSLTWMTSSPSLLRRLPGQRARGARQDAAGAGTRPAHRQALRPDPCAPHRRRAGQGPSHHLPRRPLRVHRGLARAAARPRRRKQVPLLILFGVLRSQEEIRAPDLMSLPVTGRRWCAPSSTSSRTRRSSTSRRRT